MTRSNAIATDHEPHRLEGRVVRAQSGFYTVETSAGNHVAVLRGRLKKDRRQEGLVALGDLVSITLLELPEGESGQVTASVEEVLPRRSVIARRAPGPKGVWSQDVVVANIDLLVCVLSCREPDPNLRFLDRLLAVAAIDKVPACVVMTKADLGLDEGLAAQLEVYRRIGYPVILCSTRDGSGHDALRELITGRISAVVGASGVGKSSLINALEPGLAQRVGEISDAVNKGRHTTRVGALLPLSGGGMVADTPGLREMGVWRMDPGELEWAFPEFHPFIHQCRFSNCSHHREPGCAVRAAAEQGTVAAGRYDSYLRMLQEP